MALDRSYKALSSAETKTNMNEATTEGVIHEVHLDDGVLCVRIDTDGVSLEENKDEPILIAWLTGCADIAKVFAILQQAIGQYLYYWTGVTKAGTTSIVLEVDYGTDEIEIVCDSVKQAYSAYTRDDLQRKCQWLVSSYRSSQDELHAVRQKHHILSSGLMKAINNELDRCEKKLAFFSGLNPERAAEMQGEILAYERVLTRMAQLTKRN